MESVTIIDDAESLRRNTLTTFVVNVCRWRRQQSFETQGASNKVGIVRVFDVIAGDAQ